MNVIVISNARLPNASLRIQIDPTSITANAVKQLVKSSNNVNLPPVSDQWKLLVPGGKTWDGDVVLAAVLDSKHLNKAEIPVKLLLPPGPSVPLPPQPPPQLISQPPPPPPQQPTTLETTPNPSLTLPITFQGLGSPTTILHFKPGATFADAAITLATTFPEFADSRTYSFMIKGGKTPSNTDVLSAGMTVRVIKTQRKHLQEEQQDRIKEITSRLTDLEKDVATLQAGKRHRLEDPASVLLKTATCNDELASLTHWLDGQPDNITTQDLRRRLQAIRTQLHSNDG